MSCWSLPYNNVNQESARSIHISPVLDCPLGPHPRPPPRSSQGTGSAPCAIGIFPPAIYLTHGSIHTCVSILWGLISPSRPSALIVKVIPNICLISFISVTIHIFMTHLVYLDSPLGETPLESPLGSLKNYLTINLGFPKKPFYLLPTMS